MENTVIEHLVKTIWFDTTGLRLDPTASLTLAVDSDLYLATVVFFGSQHGSLTIITGTGLADQIASRMFQAPLETISCDDVHDSFGELANVLAGNLKNDFFGTADLSRPVVMEGRDSLTGALAIDAIFQKVFVCDNSELVLVQVCQVEYSL